MVTPVEIKITGKETLAFLHKLPYKVAKIGRREAWNVTQYGAKALIEAAYSAGIRPWKGKLLTYRKGIEPRKLGKNKYGVFIPYYGKRLDSDPVEGNLVDVKRGTLLDSWLKTSNKSPWKGQRFRPKRIRVHGYPFINEGYRKMLERLDLTVQKIANKSVRG